MGEEDSPLLLLRIISKRKLYTGMANRSVPLVLQENPSNIPISTLRPLFCLRDITRRNLNNLARGRRTPAKRPSRSPGS